MKHENDSEPDSRKTFLEILGAKSDSEFKFFVYVEDAIRGIIIFFFQVITAIGLMLLQPLSFGRSVLNLQEDRRIPKPLTFLAFSAVIASISFRGKASNSVLDLVAK